MMTTVTHAGSYPQPMLEVGRATTADVATIALLVNAYARRGDLLPRTPDAIAATVDDWVVARLGGRVIACGSLLPYTAALAEVRSLAVAENAQGLGLGRQIVGALIDEGRRRGIPTLFALTRAVPFFQKMGFSVTEKERFPQKVWTDCQACPLMEMCDETAMVLELVIPQ
jgi:amino-acid N-acetyltransferase